MYKFDRYMLKDMTSVFVEISTCFGYYASIFCPIVLL